MKKITNFLKVCGLAVGLTMCMSISALAGPGDPVPQESELNLLVGAAVRDITPTEEMYPIDGVGRTTLEGVLDPLHTRVIALQSGENTALIVSNETGKGPYGPLYAQELSEHTGVPVEAILYTATHAHATPEITQEIDMSYITYDEADPEVTNLQKWGRLVYDQMMEAADEALANLRPATVGIGYSDSYVNVNRNTKYTDENGKEYWSQGYGFDGFSDKTLAVVEFCDMETEEPIAFVLNYAVHGVVMYANTALDGATGVSSDLLGYVCNAFESQNPGAVAMYTSGAAGDQNPIFGNEYFTPSIETGTKETTLQGSLDVLQWLGKLNYYDAVQAVKDIDTRDHAVDISYGYDTTTIPGTGENAEYLVPLKLLRIGNIAFVGFGGEMFNEVGVTAIENSVMEHTLWVNHAWTNAEQSTGYHSTDLITVEGGQGRNTRYLPGYLTDAVTELMNKMIGESLFNK